MKNIVALLSFALFAPIAINGQNQAAINPSAGNSMGKAYELSGEMVKDRLEREDKRNKKIIEDVASSDLVVVDGTYDHIHLVLSYLKLPFVRISPEQIMRTKLEPHQTVFVNCIAAFPSDAAHKLAEFVKQGGQLITTDWALKAVLEVGFPRTVAYNNNPTGDEVVRIEVADKTDPLIAGFLDEETAPVWWLEGSSYPIKILDKDRVKTLIKSKELKKKYGEEAVLVRFEYGKGVVYHMISHFYLQRTETKDAKQSTSAAEYMKAKNISIEKAADLTTEAQSLSYGEAQSANTSAEFIMRAVVNQKNRQQEK